MSRWLLSTSKFTPFFFTGTSSGLVDMLVMVSGLLLFTSLTSTGSGSGSWVAADFSFWILCIGMPFDVPSPKLPLCFLLLLLFLIFSSSNWTFLFLFFGKLKSSFFFFSL
uniref:Uncharacterized protein n=1 Tax=Opuntia streptacantha TaxID=393608 RepID=A0A7C9CX00_OPUST